MFNRHTVAQLKEICRRQGLPVSGLKADVVRRLDIHFNVGGGVELDRLITEIIQRFASMTDRRRGRIVNNVTQNNTPEIKILSRRAIRSAPGYSDSESDSESDDDLD